jgi:hypothetical protein
MGRSIPTRSGQVLHHYKVWARVGSAIAKKKQIPPPRDRKSGRAGRDDNFLICVIVSAGLRPAPPD